MEIISGWAAIFSIIGVLAFEFYYPGYVQRTRGCSVFKVWRLVVLGGAEFFAIGLNQDQPAYFIAMLALIAVMLSVAFLNKTDAKSWLHGILITLWQSLVFIAIVYVLVQLSNTKNKKR